MVSRARRWFFLGAVLGLLVKQSFLVQAGEEANQSVGCLLDAYPKHLCRVDKKNLVGCDGRIFPIALYHNMNASRSFFEMLRKPDLHSQMLQIYPQGKGSFFPPKRNHDPGRIRYEPLFDYIYGSNPSEVRENLVRVRWLPSTVNRIIRVSRVYNIHDKLRRISREIESGPKEIIEIAGKIMGSFSHRKIAGTTRKSAHSYGIALDLGGEKTDYWRWQSPRKKIRYRNRLPTALITLFEKYGFIWGGKWYHYDTMHFEYRPELLIKSCSS